MIRRTDTTMDIKKREETDKQWPTKYYRENERLSNTNLIKTGENSNAQEG